MKPRIPLAYAGLLIVALVAVVGFAAFSPTSEEPTDQTVEMEAVPDASASARVASAILALRVSDGDTRTATTVVSDDTAPGDPEPETAAVPETTSTASEPTTTQADPTTSSSTTTTPSTTRAPTTAAAPTTTDSTPPSLAVTSPDDGDTVDDRVVTFSGTTERGASVTSGPYEADVDDDGSWSLQLVLSEGPNGAVFTATDSAGNSTSVRIVVTYEPPVATTTTTQPPATTTTSAPAEAPKWSPLWPADAGGKRNVEAWRPLVAKYWPGDLVDCALNLIDLESQGDPRAYNSSTGAEGLFQHLSKYWKGRAAAAGFKDGDGLYASPYNAEANIAAAWLIASGAEPWHRPWSVDPYYGACQE